MAPKDTSSSREGGRLGGRRAGRPPMGSRSGARGQGLAVS